MVVFDDNIKWQARLEAAQQCQDDLILIVSAPTRRTKEFYRNQLQADRIITIMPNPIRAMDQMTQRPGKKGRLHPQVEYWYNRHSPHPMEEIYERGTDILDRREGGD